MARKNNNNDIRVSKAARINELVAAASAHKPPSELSMYTVGLVCGLSRRGDARPMPAFTAKSDYLSWCDGFYDGVIIAEEFYNERKEY